jgi:hypothetical protein
MSVVQFPLTLWTRQFSAAFTLILAPGLSLWMCLAVQVYGQGMTVSALEAEALHNLLKVCSPVLRLMSEHIPQQSCVQGCLTLHLSLERT